MSRKFYPEFIKEWDGIRFHFNSEKKHYTLRFAGRPLLLLEYYYKKRGGKDFEATYLLAKSGKIHTPEVKLLIESANAVSELFEIITDIQENGKSTFVLYVNDVKKWNKS